MKRSEMSYPLFNSIPLEECDALRKAWEEGWLDDFSEEHFLIRAINGKLNDFDGKLQYNANNIPLYSSDNLNENFLINFSFRLHSLIQFFGESYIKNFIVNQLSAGKKQYSEGQFFRAFSEVVILCFWCNRSKSGEYEPQINGKKNPEARFICHNDIVVDIEVKTGGFEDIKQVENMVIPTVLLDDIGRIEFVNYCHKHGIRAYMPRVHKLKDFLNSAADKFDYVDHTSHLNLLYINWTFSEFIDSGFEEALSILSNEVNGILTHKDIGYKIGLSEDVFDKITAVIVYTESLSGLMFNDFRWVWTRNELNHPHFGIIGMHIVDDIIFDTSGMNPKAFQESPCLLAYLHESSHAEQLFQIIKNNILAY